jgi:lysosomal acid lipase/cholesteryl ester hydrolase
LHTDTDAFWDFTYDEMAQYDAPAMINFILEYTNMPSLAYVGHSEGTIQMFALPYWHPELLSSGKIAFFGALAPVAYVHHQESPLIELLAYMDVAEIFELLGVRQFLPGVYLLNKIAPDMCNILPTACDEVLWLLCGPSTDMNETRLQVYVSETPADTSVKNMVHWSQGVTHEKFRVLFCFVCIFVFV